MVIGLAGELADVVNDVCLQLTQSGMSFEVMRCDSVEAVVAVRLTFDDVDCLDCVMPKEHLEGLIASSLERRLGKPFRVDLDDPRPSAVAAASSVGESWIFVLDPTAPGKGGDPNPGPPAGDLNGKRVLFRVDALWKSWDWTVDEWSKLLRDQGAEVATWRRWQGLSGDDGLRAQAEYEELIQRADVVIAGLANCGSCSAWTIRDALSGLNAGRSTIAIATEHFVPLAKVLAEDGLRPGLRLHTLPYPFDLLPEAEVRDIARHSFDQLMVDLQVGV